MSPLRPPPTYDPFMPEAARTLYLVCYDIASPKRLYQVHKFLLGGIKLTASLLGKQGEHGIGIVVLSGRKAPPVDTYPQRGYHNPMKQQDTLRQTMQQSGQTRAQLAAVLGVSPRTLDKWLLPESSKDFRRIPETAIRLIANQYGVRKSSDLTLPYDWSNPAIPDNALILSVLRRAIFSDVARVCADFGLERVSQQVDATLTLVPETERPILARILTRMLRSIELAQQQLAQQKLAA